ncbi:unnamed protein product [Orchesella dallaii]|uniref:Uncharacterized protein n=1 Tax=Orchesella dallaii TaxID=48710 RepID=A0ABP1REA8_9HEXA
MLWFRLGAVIALLVTLIFAITIGCSTFVMCVYPPNPRSMNQDPYYNNSLLYYCLIVIAEVEMISATSFGFIIAFRVWRNNHQMDHRLRHLFTIWLAALGIGLVIIFIIGILGMVRLREPQEELMTYFEIFSKYNQDIKFVGSFERYQRENSCCGINGPDDWMLAQFKQGGGTSMGGGMGGFGFGGYDSSYMGSPSTGKCHLTPRNSNSVIIIPEDEVSNLIVIEPESSASTVNESYMSPNVPAGWSGSVYSANGSVYSSYSKPHRGSRYTQGSHSRSDRGSRFTYNGYSGSRSFYPNSRRTVDNSRATKFSNFHGSIPTIGGPHSHYFPPHQEEVDDEMINQNYQEPSYGRDRSSYPFREERSSFYRYAPSDSHRGNMNSINMEQGHHRPSTYTRRHGAPDIESGHFESHRGFQSGSRDIRASNISRKSHYLNEKPKQKRSFNHMLHKQEKALGGKVLAEMHVDHTRDPDPINSHMDVGKPKKGHRVHHATIAIVRNKNPPKPKKLVTGTEDGHGQTGHLAEDIYEMSGAAAVKSLIDDIALPVEHDPYVMEEGKGYVNKLHKTRKKKDQGQLAHPDKDHPRHGPIHTTNGIMSAPSIDGSQAQSLVDGLLHPKPVKKKPPPPFKPHDVRTSAGEQDQGGNYHHNHDASKIHHPPHHNGHHDNIQHHHHHSHHPNHHENQHHSHHADHHSQHHDHYRSERSFKTEVLFKTSKPIE